MARSLSTAATISAVVCSTDDPTDTLEAHVELGRRADPVTRVYPTLWMLGGDAAVPLPVPDYAAMIGAGVTVLDEAARDHQADSARPAGHDGDFACDGKKVFHQVSSSNMASSFAARRRRNSRCSGCVRM